MAGLSVPRSSLNGCVNEVPAQPHQVDFNGLVEAACDANGARLPSRNAQRHPAASNEGAYFPAAFHSHRFYTQKVFAIPLLCGFCDFPLVHARNGHLTCRSSAHLAFFPFPCLVWLHQSINVLERVVPAVSWDILSCGCTCQHSCAPHFPYWLDMQT
jgi:hypothetical protein